VHGKASARVARTHALDCLSAARQRNTPQQLAVRVDAIQHAIFHAVHVRGAQDGGAGKLGLHSSLCLGLEAEQQRRAGCTCTQGW
jgi:hypothetical protein